MIRNENAYALGRRSGLMYDMLNRIGRRRSNQEIMTFPRFSSCFDERREMRFGIWSSSDRDWYDRVLPRMYEDAVSETSKVTRRIPKIVHQIWLGGPLPSKFRELREKWMDIMGSEWKFILWDEVSIEMFKLQNIKAYKSAGNYGEKSDIARYEILYRMGGVYLDTDMEPYKSLDSIHSRFEFYAGIANTGTVELNNALIASVSGHVILKECIDQIRDNNVDKTKNLMSLIGSFLPLESKMLMNQESKKNNKAQDPMSTITRTGPGMFTRAFMKIATSDKYNTNKKIVAFPPSFFYPFPNNKTEEVDIDKRSTYRRDESFCTHHWAATWNVKNQTRHKW